MTAMWSDGARRIEELCEQLEAHRLRAPGGLIPLFFDWHFGMIISAADRPISRTAYLHVDYKKVTPIDTL